MTRGSQLAFKGVPALELHAGLGRHHAAHTQPGAVWLKVTYGSRPLATLHRAQLAVDSCWRGAAVSLRWLGWGAVGGRHELSTSLHATSLAVQTGRNSSDAGDLLVGDCERTLGEERAVLPLRRPDR